MVPIRDITVAVVISDGEGHGHVDVLVAGMESRIRDLFEQPREVKDAFGKILRVLKPWTHESMKYLLGDGLHREGLMGERADGP
ncbi:MAG: hypothetical protein K8T20_11945 [Planctomycetes bacterium]|nr:hypothetical protein [Planctomycetota bacterium]